MSDSRFTATKFDAKKPPMELIPWEAMEGVARVLDFGRVKYAAHNWRKGFEWGRLVGAGLRHVFKFLGGEDLDPESGEHHIDHALCCFMFLSAHIKGGLGKDDRAHVLLKEQPEPVYPTAKRYVVMWSGKGFGLADQPACIAGIEGVRFVTREKAVQALAASGWLKAPFYVAEVDE